MKRYLGLILTVALLTSCTMPEWIGGSSGKSKLKGDRITLLKVDTSVTPDASVADQQVHLPRPRRNTRWYKSAGEHVLTEQNPRAPWDFTQTTTIETGEGGTDITPILLRPVIADQKIFVMDAEGTVSAYPVENPEKPLWQTHIKLDEEKARFTRGGLAYDQGKLFVNTGYTLVVALDASNGKSLWQKTLASVTRSAPDARDGRVYVQTVDSRLYALSSLDGSIVWIHEGIAKNLIQYGGSSPVAMGDEVISSYASGEIYGLKSYNGKRIWSDSLAYDSTNNLYLLTDIDSTPVVSEGRAFAAGKGGVLAAFDLFNGTRVWEQEFPSSNDLWVAADFVYGLSDHAELAAFYTLNGGVKWVTKLPRYEDEKDRKDFIYWSGPVMAGSRLLVVSSNGRMLSIAPMNGKIIDEYEVPKGIYSAPVIAYDNVYLYDNDADITILSGKATVPTQSDFDKKEAEMAKKQAEKNSDKNVVDRSTEEIGNWFSNFLKHFKAEKKDDAEE